MEQTMETINQKDTSGKQTGLWKGYHSNGKLHYEGNYESGNKTGLWKGYHSNGNISWEGVYENGKQTGLWKWYYSNGELKEIIYYS
jgi:antitoxin component YwqK of YwqJK toxin-antitoxin module